MCGGGIRGWRCRIRGNRALRLSLRHEIVVSNKIFDELSLPSLNVRISATSQTPTFPFGERNRYRATAHAVFPSTISCLTSTDVVSRKKACALDIRGFATCNFVQIGANEREVVGDVRLPSAFVNRCKIASKNFLGGHANYLKSEHAARRQTLRVGRSGSATQNRITGPVTT